MHMKVINEITLAVAVGALALFFFDPFMIVMPDSVVYMLGLALMVLFVMFSIFVWNEQARDEREQHHKMIAARIGFLVGGAVLVLGIVVQAITGHVDVWLVWALIAMILGKFGALYYVKRNR